MVHFIFFKKNRILISAKGKSELAQQQGGIFPCKNKLTESGTVLEL